MSRFLLIDGASKGKVIEAEFSHPYQDHFVIAAGQEENYRLYPFHSQDGTTYLIGSVLDYDNSQIETLIKTSKNQYKIIAK
ncbi:hypothetical protein NG99_22340 [Erwinia typographi]|uniref:Uncharacterized protein n=1 Tax=Erwinia typographi TaxID=371042 RepID=A0A0A3ZQU0_9GAMM|nr:hypothetical protein [Erwinia typographi]KGT88043.1 hypothetical protein NG99_22340 [Erwinia typographi]